MSNSNFSLISGGSSGSATPATMELRLTLASGTPVMTTGVTAATTLYLTPYKGNSIGLYSGGSWTVFQTAQVSLSLASLSANTLYDIFAYNSSGAVTLEALAWSNSGAGTSARDTALAYQDGILVKSGDSTRRYLGTIRTVAAGQTEFSFGADSSLGTEAKFYVWNYYNRVDVSTGFQVTTSSWAYVTATWRPANNSTSFRCSFVCGVPEDTVEATYTCNFLNNSSPYIGVGLNSTTAPSGATGSMYVSLNAGYSAPQGRAKSRPALGFNFTQALERGSGTFYGDSKSNYLDFAFMM